MIQRNKKIRSEFKKNLKKNFCRGEDLASKFEEEKNKKIGNKFEEEKPVVEEKIWRPHQSWVNSDTLYSTVPEGDITLILLNFI